MDEPRVVILGAGLAGLVLALALEHHVGIKAEIFEQAPSFDSNAGGAIGLYPNGLRVLRDISPQLLEDVRAVAYPYLNRRWMRHDGTEVACGDESKLCPTEGDWPQLASVGIRRWRLQKVLCDHVAARGMRIHFGKRVERVDTEPPHGGTVYAVHFADGSCQEFDIVFGADGVKSKTRDFVHSDNSAQVAPAYTGITCLMGAAKIPRPVRGICFPSAATTKCHACYYPTGPAEQVFQIFFPTAERPETWGTLGEAEAKKECTELAKQLERDGWHTDFIQPIQQAENVLRVGLRAREPLDRWVRGRVVLLGDAAHPPVPYIGQGAMMAFEDAGVLALLLKQHYRSAATAKGPQAAMADFDNAMALYEQLRIPRARSVLGASHKLGATQQLRADSWLYNWLREWAIWLQVKWYGTLPIMLPGAAHNYADGVAQLAGGDATSLQH